MSSPFERLWKDRMDIYRYQKIKENNITKSGEKLIESDVKCHYSAGSLADTGSEVPTLVSSHKLFCRVGKVQEGDKVIVTQRNGSKVTLIVGEGFPYSGGAQHTVKRDGKA
jgi:hypothetical protein